MWKDLIYDIHQTTTIWIRMYKMHMGVMKEKGLALCDLAHGGSFYMDSKICYFQDMGDSSYRGSIPFSKLWKHSEVGRTSYYSASRPFHIFTGTLFKIELHLLNSVWFGGFQTYAGDSTTPISSTSVIKRTIQTYRCMYLEQMTIIQYKNHPAYYDKINSLKQMREYIWEELWKLPITQYSREHMSVDIIQKWYLHILRSHRSSLYIRIQKHSIL